MWGRKTRRIRDLTAQRDALAERRDDQDPDAVEAAREVHARQYAQLIWRFLELRALLARTRSEQRRYRAAWQSARRRAAALSRRARAAERHALALETRLAEQQRTAEAQSLEAMREAGTLDPDYAAGGAS